MKRMFSLMLVLCLLLAGCGNTAETTAPSTEPTETTAAPTESQAPTETTAPVETTVPEETGPVNPLTGEELEAENTRRPIAVMINNSSSALPQCGIGQADVIYEILAEGNITRFMAIFTDTMDAGPIGPVRSLRPYYLDIMRGYDALCTSAGGSTQAESMISSLDYDRMNGINGASAGYFYRDSWRAENKGYEHSLFVDGDDLFNGAAELDMRTAAAEGWNYGRTFDDAVPFSGQVVEKAVVNFISTKSTTLTFDSGTSTYSAYQQGQDLIDGNTQELVRFRNVIVLLTDVRVIDDIGRRSVRTVGEGEGYYLRDGKMISIRWSRADEESPFVYTDEAGNPLTMGVGKTYVAVIGTDCTVDFS